MSAGAYWVSGTAFATPFAYPALPISRDAGVWVGLLLYGLSALGSLVVLVRGRSRVASGLLAIGVATGGFLHAPAYAHHRVFLALLFALASIAPRGKLATTLSRAFALLYACAAAAKLLDPHYLSGLRVQRLLRVVEGLGPLPSPAMPWPPLDVTTQTVAHLLLPLSKALSWLVVVAETILALGYLAAGPRAERTRTLAWPLHLGLLWATGSPFGVFMTLCAWAPTLLRAERSRTTSEKVMAAFFVMAMSLAGPLAHPFYWTAAVPLGAWLLERGGKVRRPKRGPS